MHFARFLYKFQSLICKRNHNPKRFNVRCWLRPNTFYSNWKELTEKVGSTGVDFIARNYPHRPNKLRLKDGPVENLPLSKRKMFAIWTQYNLLGENLADFFRLCEIKRLCTKKWKVPTSHSNKCVCTSSVHRVSLCLWWIWSKRAKSTNSILCIMQCRLSDDATPFSHVNNNCAW